MTVVQEHRLSKTMIEALQACPSEWERCPHTVTAATRLALEQRGLIETDERRVLFPHGMSAGRYWHWRRTLAGENVAIEILAETGQL